MSSRKSRVTEAVLKPPVDISSGAIISETASLVGTHSIRIGPNSAIHPKAKLNSSLGPITVGSGCIVNERTLVAAPDTAGLILGNGVVVEVNAVVEARSVGDGSVIEVGGRVGKCAVVGKNCKLAPLTTVADGEVVPDNTVIYGYGERRIDASGSAGARRKLNERHIESLRVLIPSNPSKFMA